MSKAGEVFVRDEARAGFVPWADMSVNSVPISALEGALGFVFVLGQVDDRHAIVVPGENWRIAPSATLLPLARRAWKQVTGIDCEENMDRVIAQGWLRLAKSMEH